MIIHGNEVAPTIVTTGIYALYNIPRHPNKNEIRKMFSFPHDYDFMESRPFFVMGMCVPSVMIARIAYEIHQQWFVVKQQGNNKCHD
jgi:DNA (cytosine-5)-methyltransferase 1